MDGFSRRTFLKQGLVGFSTITFVPGSFGRWVPGVGDSQRRHVDLFTGRLTLGIPTTCGLCDAGCGMLAFLDEGALVGLAGNPKHPANRGGLCSLGAAAMNLYAGPARIRKPLRRTGTRGQGQWREISWTEALEEVTSRLRAVREKQPSDAVAFVSPERALSPFIRRFGAGFEHALLVEGDGYERDVERRVLSSLWPSAAAGLGDLGDADWVLNFGANPLGSIRHLVSTGRQWSRGIRKGARWVSLDPRLSETAAASDTWIPLSPGTDGALALAMAHLILQKGRDGRGGLEPQPGVDRERLRKLLQTWTPERAAAVSGVPAETICGIAEEFLAAQRPVAILGSGVTARSAGFASAQAVLLLNLLLGNVGRKGGYRVVEPFRWRQPDPVADAGKVRTLGGSLFRELKAPGLNVAFLFTNQADPASTDPECHETARMLADGGRIPFHVAMSTHWTETAALADLVLPAATYLESWGLHEGVDPSTGSVRISLRQPVLGPPDSLQSQEAFLLACAKKLDPRMAARFTFETMEEYYRGLLDATFGPGVPEASLEGLLKTGFHVVGKQGGRSEPASREPAPAEPLSLVATLSEAAAQIEKELETLKGPLASETKHLLLHASPTLGDDARHCRWIEEINHADPVMMHPDAARAIGCADGDWVLMKGPVGGIRTRVRLTEGIHPSAVAMSARARDRLQDTAPVLPEVQRGGDPEGSLVWWQKEICGENVRSLIPWPQNTRRDAPGWSGTLVRVERTDPPKQEDQGASTSA